MFDPLFCKILVAFDGSEPSKRALDHAAKIAAMFEGELTILTVVPPPSIPIFPNQGLGPLDWQNYQERMRELYGKSLQNAEKELSERYPDLKVDVLLLEGRPSAIITEEAEKRGINLIIMGSRGQGGITGWILGSTSRRVVDQCTKPILIVK